MQNQSAYTERDLLQQVAAGSGQAFRSLFDQYRNKIYSLGIYLTRSETLAEEMVQDVFLKVWEKREQLADIDYFNAWLRTVAKNICSNYLRNLAIENLVMKRYSSANQKDHSSPENELMNKQYEAIVNAAIEQLPPQQQKVFRLSRQSEKKQSEIAQELSISVYTVKEYMKLAQRSVCMYIESHLDITIMLAFAIYLY